MRPQTVEQRYLEALRRLRVNADHLEEMAKWKEDLTSRLWRAMAVAHVTGLSIDDIAALELEVSRYIAVAEAISKKRKL